MINSTQNSTMFSDTKVKRKLKNPWKKNTGIKVDIKYILTDYNV